jgi:PAS domain S-box-containing protein
MAEAESSVLTAHYLAALPIAVFAVVVETGAILASSAAGRVQFGYTSGMPREIWVHAVAPQNLRALLERVAATNTPAQRRFQARRTDGTRFPAQWTCAPIPEEAGQVVLMVEDCTAIERAKARLRQRARYEGALLMARAAHEHLHKDLTLVLGYLDLASARGSLPANAAASVQQAIVSAEHMAQVLDALRHFERLANLAQDLPGDATLNPSLLRRDARRVPRNRAGQSN